MASFRSSFASCAAVACVSVAAIVGCRSDDVEPVTPGKDKTLGVAISTAATRVAAHIEAAKSALDGIQLTDAAHLATVGNLDAALAGLPRPTVDDLAFVAALKSVDDYRRAAKESEAAAKDAKDALDAAMRDLSAMREGREQDRRDADARLWRIAAVGLVVASAVTGYIFKDALRSSVLGGVGIACAVIPAWIDKADDALSVGAWVVLGLLACAAVWLGLRLWRSDPPAKFRATVP